MLHMPSQIFFCEIRRDVYWSLILENVMRMDRSLFTETTEDFVMLSASYTINIQNGGCMDFANITGKIVS